MACISEIRSLLPSQVPILPLPATITKHGRFDVSRTLALLKEVVIAMSPSKSNIKLIKMPLISIKGSLRKVAEDLIYERLKFPRTIIYC